MCCAKINTRFLLLLLFFLRSASSSLSCCCYGLFTTAFVSWSEKRVGVAKRKSSNQLIAAVRGKLPPCYIDLRAYIYLSIGLNLFPLLKKKKILLIFQQKDKSKEKLLLLLLEYFLQIFFLFIRRSVAKE